jgi:prepilin-type N-terminal cleavage/methylation domain-containing protein
MAGRKSRQGFTLVELLTVMAIIAILMSLLVPATNAVRERARTTQCTSNVRNLALAMIQYESTHQVLPINWSPDSKLMGQNTRGHSWISMVLPQLDNEVFFRRIKFGEKLMYKDSGTNKDNTYVAQQSIPVLRCPSDTHRGFMDNQVLLSSVGNRIQLGVTNYKACAGSNWGSEVLTGTGNKNVKFTKGRNAYNTDGRERGNGIICRGAYNVLYTTSLSDIKDGSSNTIAVGECTPQWDGYSAWYGWDNATATCGIPLNWYMQRNNYRPSDDPVIALRTRIDGFQSRHAGGGCFAFCDASAKWLSNGIDHETYRAMGTIDAEDIVGEY